MTEQDPSNFKRTVDPKTGYYIPLTEETEELYKKAQEATEEKKRKAEEAKVKEKERLQKFKDSRDPIQDDILSYMKAMHISMEKTRKWVTFMGVILLLSLIAGVFISIDTFLMY